MSTLIAAAILAAVPMPAVVAPIPGTTVQNEDPCDKAMPVSKCSYLQKIKDYSATTHEERKDKIRHITDALNDIVEQSNDAKPEKPRFRSKCEDDKLRHHIDHIKTDTAKCGGGYNRNDLIEKINVVLKKV